MDYHIARINSKLQRRIAKDFVNLHHSYITWSDRPSRKLYWLLYENRKLVGVFGLGSAFAKPKDIANFMKKNNIEFNELANNLVFCLYGHNDKNAGSKLLSMIRKDAVLWWYERYNNKLKAFQTFILPPRDGAMYKADNWKLIGKTAGGKVLRTKTLKKDEYQNYDGVETRTFKDGTIRYLKRDYIESEAKLIFVKLTTKKEFRKLGI